MAAVGQRIKKQTYKRMSAQVLLKPWYLCQKKKWAIGQIILMYIMLAMDPTFSRVDLFVVRHHVVSHNGLCQLARGLRTESCEGQNRENHKIEWERLNYPTSLSSSSVYGLTANFRSLSSHASAALKSRWLTSWRKKNETHTSVSIKYQISSHHKLKLIYPTARFTPAPEVRDWLVF